MGTRRPSSQPAVPPVRPTTDADRIDGTDLATSELPERLDTPIEVPETDLLEQRRAAPLDDEATER